MIGIVVGLFEPIFSPGAYVVRSRARVPICRGNLFVQVTAGLLVSTAISYAQTTWRGNRLEEFPRNSALPEAVVYHPPLHDLVPSSTSGWHVAPGISSPRIVMWG
jgi:hypothetical protein